MPAPGALPLNNNQINKFYNAQLTVEAHANIRTLARKAIKKHAHTHIYIV